jgi:hypothetical protein
LRRAAIEYNNDPWGARELLDSSVRQAAHRVGDGHNHHHLDFGPSNLNLDIHRVSIEYETDEISTAQHMADEIDINSLNSLERKTSHLYQVARSYDPRGNDTAVSAPPDGRAAVPSGTSNNHTRQTTPVSFGARCYVISCSMVV